MKNLLIISFIIFCSFQIKTLAQNDVQSVDGLMQKGQYSQALVVLEKLNIGDSTQIEILQKQAFCNFKLGRFAQAKKLYYSILRTNPESTEILLQIATIGEKEYNYLEAFKSYQKLNQLDSSDYELGIADVYDKNGDTEFAIRNLQRFVNSRPKAVFRLAEIYEKKKNDKEMALIFYQEYIRACGKLKKPTADCNFIELATQRINKLNPKLKLELPKIVAQKDSNEVTVDTIRHD